jgi:hypothetical protein
MKAPNLVGPLNKAILSHWVHWTKFKKEDYVSYSKFCFSPVDSLHITPNIRLYRMILEVIALTTVRCFKIWKYRVYTKERCGFKS